MEEEASGAEHVRSTSRSSWIRWTDLAFILGGVLVVATMILAAFSEIGQSIGEGAFESLGVLIAVLLLVALGGLYARYKEAIGAIATAGIFVSALSALSVIVRSVAIAMNVELPDLLYFVGLFIGLPGGMVLFGYMTLRTRILPRWNALPVLIGLTPLGLGPAVLFGLLPDAGLTMLLAIGAYLLSGIGWILLGFTLRTDIDASAPVSTPGSE